MQNDKITLKDLSVFDQDAGTDVFALIDNTITQAGRLALQDHILHPPDTLEQLIKVQDVIKYWWGNPDKWPHQVSNGTIVMLEKFFEAADATGTPPTGISLMLGSFFQKILNKNQYFFTQFSLSHLSDFFKACMQLTMLLKNDDVPPLLQEYLIAIQDELKHRLVADIISLTKETPYSQLMKVSHRARRELKNMVYRLKGIFSRLDAWQSMAQATLKHEWTFPELLPAKPVFFDAGHLYHPLLKTPLSYSIKFDDTHNFLLLTGANMSGKTTFMRSLGLGALLAHLGMGVPAKKLRISFLQGVITNMHVEDNILMGESYFFAEVQRMKHTARKLLQEEPHLVLMDELFKGTNVHDAYECTRAVVEGLLNHPSHFMVLSTHLYEVAQHFSQNEKILFAYFVTKMAEDGSYHFTYELANGISNDRIGYRILQKEGVIDLLKRH